MNSSTRFVRLVAFPARSQELIRTLDPPIAGAYSRRALVGYISVNMNVEPLSSLDTAEDMWREAMLSIEYPLNHPAYAERMVWQLITRKNIRRARSLVTELPYNAKRERWHGLCCLGEGDLDGAADAFIDAVLLSLEERNPGVRAECLTHLGRLPDSLLRQVETELSQTRVLEGSDKTEKSQARLVGDVPDVVAVKNQTNFDHSEELLRFMLTRPGVKACESLERAARATALLSGSHYRRHSTAAALATLERAVKDKSVAAVHSGLIRLRNVLRRGTSCKNITLEEGKDVGEAVQSILEGGRVDELHIGRIMRALGCKSEEVGMNEPEDGHGGAGGGRESACERPGHLDMTNTFIAEAGSAIWGFPEPVRVAGLDGRISSSSAYSCGPEFEGTGLDFEAESMYHILKDLRFP